MENPAQEGIFLFMSEGMQELLLDNGIDVVELLHQQGLQVEKRFKQNPASSKGYREPALLLLAAGVTAVMIATAISKVVDAIGRNKKVLVKELVCVPLLDKDGTPLRDESGQVMKSWIDRYRWVETEKNARGQTAMTASFHPETGLELTLADEGINNVQ